MVQDVVYLHIGGKFCDKTMVNLLHSLPNVYTVRMLKTSRLGNLDNFPDYHISYGLSMLIVPIYVSVAMMLLMVGACTLTQTIYGHIFVANA